MVKPRYDFRAGAASASLGLVAPGPYTNIAWTTSTDFGDIGSIISVNGIDNTLIDIDNTGGTEKRRFYVVPKVVIEVTSGVQRSTSEIELVVGPSVPSAVPETRSYGYHRNSSQGLNTILTDYIFEVPAGLLYQVRVRARKFSGAGGGAARGNLSVVSGVTTLSIIELSLSSSQI
jgi:hypothetical protein